MNRWIRITSFLVAALFASTAAGAEDFKLAYVDLQRALNEIEEGRKAKANLKSLFEKRQKELDERQEEIKKAAEDLEKKRTLLAADVVRKTEAELAKKLQDVQQTYMRHQNDLQQKEAEATGPIYERMQRIIARMAMSENFTMVLDKVQGGVVFAKPHLDLTNELIRRYNSGEGAEGGRPAAGKPGVGKGGAGSVQGAPAPKSPAPKK